MGRSRGDHCQALTDTHLHAAQPPPSSGGGLFAWWGGSGLAGHLVSVAVQVPLSTPGHPDEGGSRALEELGAHAGDES